MSSQTPCLAGYGKHRWKYSQRLLGPEYRGRKVFARRDCQKCGVTQYRNEHDRWPR